MKAIYFSKNSSTQLGNVSLICVTVCPLSTSRISSGDCCELSHTNDRKVFLTAGFKSCNDALYLLRIFSSNTSCPPCPTRCKTLATLMSADCVQTKYRYTLYPFPAAYCRMSSLDGWDITVSNVSFLPLSINLIRRKSAISAASYE